MAVVSRDTKSTSTGIVGTLGIILYTLQNAKDWTDYVFGAVMAGVSAVLGYLNNKEEHPDAKL